MCDVFDSVYKSLLPQCFKKGEKSVLRIPSTSDFKKHFSVAFTNDKATRLLQESKDLGDVAVVAVDESQNNLGTEKKIVIV